MDRRQIPRPGPFAPAFIDLGSLREDVEYLQIGRLLRPPPTGMIPALTAADAYSAASPHGAGQLRPPSPTPTVALALNSTPISWPNKTLDQRLVYAVRWQPVTWATSGPPARGQESSKTVTGVKTVFIDAMTGEFLGAILTGERSMR